MSGLFRLIEGYVSTRPKKPLGNFSQEGPQVAAADVLFDFGGLRKDVHIECDQPVTVKFNTSAGPGQGVVAGCWDWTGEFATKAFVTFTAPTDFKIEANG